MKIDTSKIPGYADMSAEEKLAALEALEIGDDGKDDSDRLKAALSKASSEAAEWKRKFRDTQTDQERKEAEAKELMDALRAENERMKKEQDIAVRTAAYVGVGFDEISARKAAEAYGSNHDDFMDAFKTFLAAHDKALQADALRSTPRPGVGGVEPSVTKEQFDKMSYADRVKFFEEQPELYKEYTK